MRLLINSSKNVCLRSQGVIEALCLDERFGEQVSMFLYHLQTNMF